MNKRFDDDASLLRFRGLFLSRMGDKLEEKTITIQLQFLQTSLLAEKIREKDIQKPTGALSVQAVRNLLGEYAGGLLYGV